MKTSTNKPEVFVSYAWGDQTPDGKIRAEVVDRLCDALEQDGFRVLRDKQEIQLGDLISTFIKSLGQSDHVVAIISDKYLRSPYCMFEIFQLWQRSLRDSKAMAERVIPLVLSDARIGDLADRIEYVTYWNRELERLSTFYREHAMNLGPKSLHQVQLVRQFAQHVDEILCFVDDVLMPRNLDAHFSDGFSAVLSALRRRMRQDPRGAQSTSPQLRKRLTDLDRDQFQRNTFERMADYFSDSLAELEHSSQEFQSSFNRIDKNRFDATIYQGGDFVAGCIVHLGGGLGPGITYSNHRPGGWQDNSFSEQLIVEDDGYSLHWRPIIKGIWGRGNDTKDTMTAEEAVEYYWSRLIRPLQSDQRP